MRTDSVRISEEAFLGAKQYILTNHGKDYMPKTQNIYKSKGRSQDAHEAIRPTDAAYIPDNVKSSTEEYKLYKLIWERFIGSQMTPAVYDTISVKITAGKTTLRASGSILKFDGYLVVYNKNEDTEKDIKIPELKEGQVLEFKEFLPLQHFTQPPPHYSEGSMVKTMEELGIGRPGTFAQTITTLLNRNYITKENKVMYPTELGQIVNDIMNEYFDSIVNTSFTAQMEENLDKVEFGELEWKSIIRNFYPNFNAKVIDAEEKIGDIEIKPEETDIPCEKCNSLLVIKYGKFGKFMGCPNFPNCHYTKPFLEEAGVDCPLCKSKVIIKKSKKNRNYFGCEAYPDCNFISWNIPTGENCPKCNAYLVKKGRKNVIIACSACKYVK